MIDTICEFCTRLLPHLRREGSVLYPDDTHRITVEGTGLRGTFSKTYQMSSRIIVKTGKEVPNIPMRYFQLPIPFSVVSGSTVMTLDVDGYTLRIDKDDYGQLRAEVRHTASGEIMDTQKVDNYEAGRWWGSRFINRLVAADRETVGTDRRSAEVVAPPTDLEAKTSQPLSSRGDSSTRMSDAQFLDATILALVQSEAMRVVIEQALDLDSPKLLAEQYRQIGKAAKAVLDERNRLHVELTQG